jgi:hypothetical protein
MEDLFVGPLGNFAILLGSLACMVASLLCCIISVLKQIHTLLLSWFIQLSDQAQTLLSENILHSNRIHLYEYLSCI